MSKLVPEKRVDKNGRSVTRHVLPPLHPSKVKSFSSIPAPSSSSSDDHEVRLSRMTISIATQMGFSLDDQSDWHEIHQTLEGYSKDFLMRLEKAWKPRTQLATAIGTMVYRDEPESFVREFAAFGGVVEDETNGMEIAMSFVRSLHHYKELPDYEDYSMADKDTQKSCRALLLVSAALEDTNFPDANKPIEVIRHDYDSFDTPVIKDKELVKLIIDRPDDYERISHIAITRLTTDAKVIIGVMDHDTRALANGVL